MPFTTTESTKALILSLSGPNLNDSERSLFKETDPLGFILFDKPGARNIENPDQLRALTDSLKDCVGRNCPVLIDQEGGRVQRLKPPHWRFYPPPLMFGEHAENDIEAALDGLTENTRNMAADLKSAGINVNCTPLLDILCPETHDVIGDRAFGHDPDLVGQLGQNVCRHYLRAGIAPVIKHIPGHGRARADSHNTLPRVDASYKELSKTDFRPFKALASSDFGQSLWAMTAHIVYDALDPDHPASASETVIRDVIRGEIGFNGLLLSDDLDMKALDVYGGIPARAEACLRAGCDVVLHCSGRLKEMEALAESVPNLSDKARKCLHSAANFA